MSAGRKKLLFILLAVAIGLWIAGAMAIPYVDGLDPKTRADAVIVNGIPFILIFIGVIVAFIDFIILMATLLNNKISEKTYRPIERVCIGGIVFGVVGMFQPFVIWWYTFGFVILLVSTIGYIFWSHIVPRVKIERAVHHDSGLGSVSIGEIEQHKVQG
jgi:hypothetical protein